jgi:hypothetical protein
MSTRGREKTMAKEDYLDDVHNRILRITEDLRAVQRELNCAAMEAPGDPELLESLSAVPEMESLQTLRSALDQMRHFLYFYMQVVMSESEAGDKIRQSLRQKNNEGVILSPEITESERLRSAADLALLQYLAEGKTRKPN